MNNVFKNLTDEQAEALYEKLKFAGLDEDAIFDEIYATDCNLDREEV